MIKKIFIVLSGIYLILAGLIIITVFLMGISSLAKEPNAQVALFKYYNYVFYIIFFLWPIITGFGIILKRNWARFSIFLLSIFTIITGSIIFLAFLIMPSPQNVKANYQVIKLFLLGLNFIFFMAIPIFFITFFNSKSVKELFASKKMGQNKTNRPFGVTLIALLSIFGALSILVYVFKPLMNNIPLLGVIMLSGKALKAYFLILAFIHTYIGIGLFKLRKAAWLTAIFSYIFSIPLSAANIFTTSELTLSQMNSSLGISNARISLASYKIFASIGLLFPIIIVIYLISKKDFFTHAEVEKTKSKIFLSK